eukprot:jgi/Ulvmu1/1931/UM012_0091.1
MAQRQCLWLLPILLLSLLSCCLHIRLCESMETDQAQPVAPCSPTSAQDLPGITFNKTQLSGGRITLPGCDNLDRIGLVVFHNGFAARKENYDEYAATLAEWGWAVLQYDLKCFPVPSGFPCLFLQNAMDEAEAFPEVLEWARKALKATDAARIDWQNVIIGGHSRGGSVAADTAVAFPALVPPEALQQEPPLQLPAACAGQGCSVARPRVVAVLLVDPVAPRLVTAPLISPQQPYFAVVGRGGLCAPAVLGADNFLPEAAPPLTAAVHVPQGGHAQFLQAPWQATFDALCGTGFEADATIRSWTSRLLSAWLLRNFPLSIDQETLAHKVEDDNRWISKRVCAGDFQPWIRWHKFLPHIDVGRPDDSCACDDELQTGQGCRREEGSGH